MARVAIRAVSQGLTPEMVAAVSKLMRNQDLIAVAAKVQVVTATRTTIGLRGRLSTRLQPNHPADDALGIAASVFDGLLHGVGDAVIGVNPASDSIAASATLLTMLDDLRQGYEVSNIDVLAIPASEYSRYKKDHKKKNYISSIQGLNTNYIGLNCSRTPFNNINMRWAISYAIDKEKILNTIYEKRGRLSKGPVPDVLRKWDFPNSYEYNPQKAMELTKKEGVRY